MDKGKQLHLSIAKDRNGMPLLKGAKVTVDGKSTTFPSLLFETCYSDVCRIEEFDSFNTHVNDVPACNVLVTGEAFTKEYKNNLRLYYIEERIYGTDNLK